MAIVSYNVYDDGVKVNSTPIPAGTSFTLTGLLSDSAHPITATNIDAAGNESTPSAASIFTTGVYEPPPDQDPLSDADAAAVDDLIDLTYTATPGVILATTGPKGYYDQAYGGIGLGAGSDRLTTDMHVRIGSDTKIFTAMAFWQCVDDGLVSLDDKLEQYVPGVPNGETITLEQVITMRSGVYNYTSSIAVLLKISFTPTAAFTEADALDYIKNGDSQYEPGSKYTYTNSAAILIGAVVEAVRGEPYLRNIMQDRIFGPLGLTETTWPTDTAIPAPAAGNGKFNVGFAGAAGALTSTIGDLTKWAQALNDGSLISPESWNIWTTSFPSTDISFTADIPVKKFAYGHFLFRLNGTDWYGHDGSIKGFGCGVLFNPVIGATVVASANVQTTDAFYKYALNTAYLLYPETFGG